MIDAINLCITVIAYACDSTRSVQMLVHYLLICITLISNCLYTSNNDDEFDDDDDDDDDDDSYYTMQTNSMEVTVPDTMLICM